MFCTSNCLPGANFSRCFSPNLCCLTSCSQSIIIFAVINGLNRQKKTVKLCRSSPQLECSSIMPEGRTACLSMNSARDIFIRDDVAALTAMFEHSAPSQEAKQAFFDTPVACQIVGEINEEPTSDSAVFISKPLLLVFMFGAERCCRLALQSLSVQDLFRIREDAGNLLHALVIGSHRKLRPAAAFDAALSTLLVTLSSAELRSLNAHSGHLGLRPVELAVRMDQFQLAERLLCSGVLQKVGKILCGPDVIVTYDLGEYSPNADNSRFLVSPCALLSADLSLERLKAIKESKILRPKSLFRAWEGLMTRNSRLLKSYGLAWMLISLLAIISCGHSLTRKKIALACNYPHATLPTWKDNCLEYTAFILALLGSVTYVLISTALIHWHRFHKKIKYRVSIKHSIFTYICLHCSIPSFLACIGTGVWGYALLARPEAFCSSTNYYFLSIALAIVDLYFFYQTIYDFQIATIVSQLVTNFFDIIRVFVPFLILKILVIIVFARIFENISNLQVIHQNQTFNSGSAADHQLFNGFTASFYSTFRLSLNIVDLSRPSTDLMIMAMHWIYVLIIPIMIFNYIIGVVSAQLSAMMEVREEKAILQRNGVSLFLHLQIKALYVIFVRMQHKRKKDYVTVYLPTSDPCVHKISGDHGENVKIQDDGLHIIELQD